MSFCSHGIKFEGCSICLYKDLKEEREAHVCTQRKLKEARKSEEAKRRELLARRRWDTLHS